MTKYGNKPIEIDGIKFQSMLEGAFYQRLRDYKKAGKIHDFKMQTVFVLHGAKGISICKYKLDFLIETFGTLENPFGTRRYVEVKGYWTAVAKLKRKLFEAEYGKLEIHTREKPWVL